jgi:hypothetical protein
VPLLTVEESTRERSNSQSITLHGGEGVLEDGFAGLSTVWASAFTFTNFIIQPANPANLPQACQQSGLVAFPFLVVLFGVINCFTCDLLAEAIEQVGVKRAHCLAELMSQRFGRVGWHLGAWSVILTNFGALAFTIALISNMITPLVGLSTSNAAMCNGWPWVVLVSGGILTPMALIKNMGTLDQASQVCTSFACVQHTPPPSLPPSLLLPHPRMHSNPPT